MGNGEYMLFSGLGAYYDNDGNLNISYALDIDNGLNTNGAQIHIWSAVIGGNTQTIGLTKRTDGTYSIYTKCSNYTKVASLSDNLCNNGINIHQWEYSNHSHDHWIMEPVNQNATLGKNYATAAYTYFLDAYPDMSYYADAQGYDSNNFVSQCLLAGGQLHQSDTWKMKRKNTAYHDVSDSTELMYSWNATSSWATVQGFWTSFLYSNLYMSKTGQQIINSPLDIWNSSLSYGDVVQIFDNSGGLAIPVRTCYYTYIGEYVIGGTSYGDMKVTYHSPSSLNRSLLYLAQTNPTSTFIFYDFTN